MSDHSAPSQPGALGERKLAVLRAVVEEYVRSGEPVGSETIAERSGLGVSSATIRNEMAALEELGYLSHPHPSAGRIPTDVGYRRYVDTLPAGGRLRDAQRKAVSAFFDETVLDLEDVLRGTTQLLSRMTQYAAVAVPPGPVDEALLRVELIDLGGAALMILVVGQHGRVDKRMIDRPDRLDAQGVTAVEKRLRAFSGLTLPDAQARALQLAAESPGAERRVLGDVAEALREIQMGEGAEHVLVGGVANLADDAAKWRADTIRRLFEALERETEMLKLLRDVAAGDLAVTIGGEHPTTGGWDASLVTAPFGTVENQVGTIGIVGPTRMDYLSVMASVRAVAKRLSDLAAELEQ
ncbi:MAG: heat-inducible transcriptional repressor HrcA [Actinomycetota bacterium]